MRFSSASPSPCTPEWARPQANSLGRQRTVTEETLSPSVTTTIVPNRGRSVTARAASNDVWTMTNGKRCAPNGWTPMARRLWRR
jgi:hypothetical protein